MNAVYLGVDKARPGIFTIFRTEAERARWIARRPGTRRFAGPSQAARLTRTDGGAWWLAVTRLRPSGRPCFARPISA